nr:MAG TPA: hypothetical protein [Caudoviricetes sp.]
MTALPRCGILSLGLCPLWLYHKSHFGICQLHKLHLCVFV